MTACVLLLGLVAADAECPADAPAHRRVSFAGGIDALVIDGAPASADAEADGLALAVAQARILSAYAAREDVLPVALGAAFSDDVALARHLEPAMLAIMAQRVALAGSAEYVVAIDKLDHAPAAPDAAHMGHLRRRQAERDARRNLETARHAFAARVVATLDRSGAPVASPRAADRTRLLTVSALIHRQSAGRAAAAIAALAPEAERLGLGLRMIGPCAPFSFVSPLYSHG
jgi:hypothetical protein